MCQFSLQYRSSVFRLLSNSNIFTFDNRWLVLLACALAGSILSCDMTKCWLIDGRSIAKKVKNATTTSKKEMMCETKRECPSCHYWVDNTDVEDDQWPGLPCGVKFDPSDIQLLDHLSAKCGVNLATAHVFIDEFIPTVDNDNGICYTHPKDLPGTREDGSSVHFFHKTRNAYASSHRKRRKIISASGGSNCTNTTVVRWHKTGKTKPVIHNGIVKGWKKIMVLYNCSNKRKKSGPVKSNWVMHQYHLGNDENEKEGEYVVSKIFYKQHQQAQESVEEYYSTTKLGMVNDPDTPVLNNPVRPAGTSSYSTTLNNNNVSGGNGILNWYDSSLMGDDDDDVDDGASGYYDHHELINVMPPELTGNVISFSNPPPKEDEHNSNYDTAFLAGSGLQQTAAADLEGSNNIPPCISTSTTAQQHDELHVVSGLTQPQELVFHPPHDFLLTDLNFDSHDSMFGWF